MNGGSTPTESTSTRASQSLLVTVTFAVCAGLRAAPLERAKVKITVKNAVCPSLPLQHTAFLTGDLAFPLTRGAALRVNVPAMQSDRAHTFSLINALVLPKPDLERS